MSVVARKVPPMTSTTSTGERADLLESLARHRNFLRHTTRDLTDEQAAARTTVSELCVGGLIKHVARTEDGWAKFIVDGPAAQGPLDAAAYEAHARRPGGCSCTSSPRRRSTPGTRTSSARPSTAPRRWAERVFYAGGDLLAQVERNGLVESRHRGSVVVLGPDGTVAESVGDVE